MDPTRFKLLQGPEVKNWLDVESNTEAWDSLHARCPWRTAFLSLPFFKVWVQHYGGIWTPILIIAADPTGRLQGLMPLAERQGLITGAGAHQAEYQGWLSEEQNAEAFLQGALQILAKAFGRHLLRIRYLPSQVPHQTLINLCKIDRRSVMTAHDSPYLDIDRAKISETLRKSSNKSKMNRLKREGTLVFRKLSSEELARYIDELSFMYDLRQGSINNSCPFTDDPKKRQFHLDWGAVRPEQLFVTGLFLSDRIIAGLILVHGDTDSHIAITAHAPSYSHHSPSKLLIYMTALLLADEGKSRLDLTPGGDPWKERFATGRERVFELLVYPTARAKFGALIAKRSAGLASRLAKRVGITSAQVTTGLARIRRLDLATILSLARLVLPRRTEYRVYRISTRGTTKEDDRNDIAVNSVRDLLRFAPSLPWQSRQKFLLDGLVRLEEGNKCYTIADGERLAHSGWLANLQEETYFAEVGQEFRYPIQGAVLFDFFSPPEFRGQGLHQATVRKMLADLAREGGTQVAYISVLSDDAISRQLIENMGFEHLCSLFRYRFLWIERKWRTPLVPAASGH